MLATESVLDPIAEAITTPQRYREARPGINSFRLLSATVTVTLLDDPRTAVFEYECHLETVGELPARYWCYHIPADAPEVEDVRAWDARGKLYPRLHSGEGPGARIELRLRQPVGPGERYTFSFGYRSRIRSFLAVDGRRRTVMYTDWFIFNVACNVLYVRVELPAGAEPLASVPRGSDDGGRITYRVRRLRPLETVMFAIAYRRGGRTRAAIAEAIAALAAEDVARERASEREPSAAGDPPAGDSPSESAAPGEEGEDEGWSDGGP